MMNKELDKPGLRLYELMGTRLSKRRSALGKTVEEVAAQLDIGADLLRSIEAGTTKMTAGMTYDIANILGVEVGSLFPDAPDSGSGEAGPKSILGK